MYKHLLLAADLTESGKISARKARQLADCHQAKLSIIHAVEPIPAYGYPGVTAIESPHIENAKKVLAELSQALNIPENCQHLKVGPTKVEILKAAKELDVDLIIVGSHGHHGLSLLLGSTANAVLNGAECDVLSLRASEPEA